MKIIKFFSFALVLSLAWVACKNTGSANTEDGTGVVLSDSLAQVVAIQKEEVAKWISILENKITETEAAISAASTDVDVQPLNQKLESLKQSLTQSKQLAEKINSATNETWAAVASEISDVHYSMKSALTGLTPDSPTTVTGSSTGNQ